MKQFRVKGKIIKIETSKSREFVIESIAAIFKGNGTLQSNIKLYDKVSFLVGNDGKILVNTVKREK
jgi:hypothetical protein